MPLVVVSMPLVAVSMPLVEHVSMLPALGLMPLVVVSMLPILVATVVVSMLPALGFVPLVVVSLLGFVPLAVVSSTTVLRPKQPKDLLHAALHAEESAQPPRQAVVVLAEAVVSSVAPSVAVAALPAGPAAMSMGPGEHLGAEADMLWGRFGEALG